MARWAQPEIVFAALAGDEAAVEELVAAVWPGCFRLAASVIGDRSLAQDAAQEACAIVHRNIRSVRNAAAIDVWRALATLSPELRDVTVLFYFDDLKSAAIASILGIPHATVRTRLARARARADP